MLIAFALLAAKRQQRQSNTHERVKFETSASKRSVDFDPEFLLFPSLKPLHCRRLHCAPNKHCSINILIPKRVSESGNKSSEKTGSEKHTIFDVIHILALALCIPIPHNNTSNLQTRRNKYLSWCLYAYDSPK